MSQGSGHLVTLADPRSMASSIRHGGWTLFPASARWKLVVIKQAFRQYHAVKEQIFRKDISDIIMPTDAGREGELVAR